MIRRALLLGFVIGLAIAPAAGASTPPGPRLASVEMIETKGSKRPEDSSSPLLAVTTYGPRGEQRRRILRGDFESEKRVSPMPFEGAAWSPDGSQLAFTGATGEEKGRIYVVAADGSGLRAVKGTRGGSNPVFSPDGLTLAFSRSRFRLPHVSLKNPFKGGRPYFSSTTWLVDAAGGKPRRLTRWRNGLDNKPSSFSPDGTVLALTKSDNNLDGPRVSLMRLDGSGSTDLVRLAEEPAFSPDGSRVAFVGYLNLDKVEAEENQDYAAPELYVVGTDGSHVRRLTRTEDVLESAPSWDPSGQRIAYVQVAADTSFIPALALLFPTGNSAMQVNADGSCRKKIVTDPVVALYGASWEPGAGREAGRLPC